MESSTLNSANGTSLQGSGGLQPGGSLQQQNQTNQYQQANGLQQEALGPEAYRSFDSLSVQGGVPKTGPSTTVGKNSNDVFLAVFLFAFLIMIVMFLRRLHTTKAAPLPDPKISTDRTQDQPILINETSTKLNITDKKKKSKAVVASKSKKKSAAKSKKRKNNKR